ncbi:hypothetical protein Q9S36_45635 [Microbacterium sp. ARD31]|uniref:hypothetical protein n=1 Tax=Microbacterium sp. ARD31 TaxID=2962576 RepID=UPI002881A9EC|nr:hypothetical protein [Microbacterium sp. ARD31]MDT0187494.1 hypothetical protein [Microbacterium sp. ARD31]
MAAPDGRPRAAAEKHAELLADPAVARPRSLGGIVVSASRPADHLDTAVGLAAALGTDIVVLASGRAAVEDITTRAAASTGLRLTVVPVPGDYSPPVVELLTDRIPAGTAGLGDLCVKRNLGLVIATLVEWETVLFLDDDIHGLTSVDVERALQVLPDAGMAGMPAREFPDNSVVCHANRLTGYEQDVFVSGSMLLVDRRAMTSFFPRIYNEDWIFMAPAIAAGRVVEAGECRQLPYDPFADPEKAYFQEFGNVVADGLMSSLHQGCLDLATKDDFWTRFIEERGTFLRGIRQRSDQADTRVIAAMAAAERRLAEITVPELIAYVRAWNTDRAAWQSALSALPSVPDVGAAVSHLGLRAYSAADVHRVVDDEETP